METRDLSHQRPPHLSTYPLSVRLTSNLIVVCMLAAGFIGLLPLRVGGGPVASGVFVIWALVSLVWVVPRRACVHCCYCGRFCHTGWGKLAARLCARKDEAAFACSSTYPRLFRQAFMVLPPAAMLAWLGYQYATDQPWSVATVVMLFNYLVLVHLNASYRSQTGCLLCGMRRGCPEGRSAETRISPATKSKTRAKYGLAPLDPETASPGGPGGGSGRAPDSASPEGSGGTDAV